MRKLFSKNSLRTGSAANRCNRLLVTIVALLAIQPFLEGELGRIVVGLVFVAIVGQGAVALADHQRHRLVVRVLGASASLAILIHVIQPMNKVRDYTFVPIILAAFAGYVGWTLLAFVVRGNSDARTRLSAALCVYLLAGFAWSMAYVATYLINPESFAGDPVDDLQLARQQSADASGAFKVFTYFSYVTLTTLGYGEITPVSNGARALVMLEAVGGVLYLAVMVASLVGARGDDSAHEPPRRGL